MKTVHYYVLTILFIGLIIIGCEKESDNKTQLTITGQLIDNSICKNELKSTTQITETPDSLSCVEYSFNAGKNKLLLKHINAGFNCCPDSLSCKVELNGDTIQIQEFEKEAQCHCNCLYDLDIEINGVEVKIYQIKFIEPYVADQDKLNFEIDLNKESNGSYCVTRKLYPWGVISLNE